MESGPAPRFDRVADAAEFNMAADRALAHREGRAVVLIEFDEPDDAVVAAAEARLIRTIRPSDLLGRLARDRFAVLVEAAGKLEQAQRVANRLASRLDEPINVGGKSVLVIARIGVAVGEGEADTVERVLARAEQAVHRSLPGTKSGRIE